MTAVTCKYHSETPARWHCDSCHISYCPACVKEQPHNREADCPVCKQTLRDLGAGNLIVPFWLRLRSFFIYPAYPAPLVLMIILTLLVSLIRLVPGWHHYFEVLFWAVPRNALLLLPIVVIFLKYCQSVLIDTAHGHLHPSSLSSDKLFENGLIVVKLLGLFAAFYFLRWTGLDLFEMPGFYLASIITALATPAAIMVLAMEDSLLHALNPATLYSIMARIGMPYFIMFVLFYLLTIAQNTMLGILSQYIDPSLSVAVYSFTTMYFYLIMFNMMGYVLYQYHEELGFSVDVHAHEHQRSSSEETATSPELRAIEILVHEGKYQDAARQLQVQIRNNPSDIEARERILKLARMIDDTTLHSQQAADYISYLFDENKVGQAASVFAQSVEHDRDFRPAKPAQRVELARYLRQSNQGKLAMAVLNNLHRDFPTFDGVPDAYLIVAQLLAEKFNDDERAIQVLEFINKNYPSHPLIGEINEYLRIIKSSTH